MSAMAPLHASNARLKSWLFDHALPLWWEVGVDWTRGGFFERISYDGRPVEAPRRLRVVARQTWVFAAASELGWPGPWRDAVEHGLKAINDVYARGDGLYAILADASGAVIDNTPAPYEQAFTLLALAGAQAALGGSFEDQAVRLRRALHAAHIVRVDGGVPEHGWLQANPMMHLLEAAQAWERIGGNPGWRTLAQTITNTALTKMIDPVTGALCEQYDAGWTAYASADVEPGHQLEWGWLLHAQDGARETARRLVEIGETKGAVDGLIIASLDRNLGRRDLSTRLWAQTERIHAHACVGNVQQLPAAMDGLFEFLDAPLTGTWRERMGPDRTFIEEAPPASSLYHIVSASLALDRACRNSVKQYQDF